MSAVTARAWRRAATLLALVSLLAGAAARAMPLADARAAVSSTDFAQQGPKLTAADEDGRGAFGSSVALSADGGTALVGAPGDGGGRGAAWIFVRRRGAWYRQARLSPSDEVGAGLFGSSVALAADGRTALVGGSGDDGFDGAAWVFVVRSAPVAKLVRTPPGLPSPALVTWVQQGPKLRASGEEGHGGFGSSVALSADASIALVGAPDDRYGAGSVRFFARAGGTWHEHMPLLGDKVDGLGQSRFGAAVSLSADGRTALVGGPGDTGSKGAAWIFARSGDAFHEQSPRLTGGGEIGRGELGVSVSLSGDGSTALVGAPADDTRKGAAWVFVRTGAGWLQQGAKLTGADEAGGGELGTGVALSGDGATALVGGSNDGGRGAAWAFGRTGSSWSQAGAKLTGGGEVGAGQLGAAVALSTDAATALAGGGADDGVKGAAWVFVRPRSGLVRPATGARAKATPSTREGG